MLYLTPGEMAVVLLYLWDYAYCWWWHGKRGYITRLDENTWYCHKCECHWRKLSAGPMEIDKKRK